MKRVEVGKFYNQFYLIPTVGIKTVYTHKENEEYKEYHIAFAFLNRGISITVFVIKEE